MVWNIMVRNSKEWHCNYSSFDKVADSNDEIMNIFSETEFVQIDLPNLV